MKTGSTKLLDTERINKKENSRSSKDVSTPLTEQNYLYIYIYVLLETDEYDMDI